MTPLSLFLLQPYFSLSSHPQQPKMASFKHYSKLDMDRFVGTSHFPLSGLKWCSVLQKENKRCYVLPSLFLLINILILSLRIGFFLLYSVCRVLTCKEVLQINMNFILLKWYMSTNVSSGESVHFLSYINEPALEFVYSWAGEWLLTLNNTLRMSEKIWKTKL